MATTEQVKDAVATKGGRTNGFLGILCWWSIYCGQITPAALRHLAAKHALPADLLPREPTASLAFRRAAAHACGGDREHEFRLILDDKFEITYGLLRFSLDQQNRRIDSTQIARLTWLPKSGKVISSAPQNKIVLATTGNLGHFRDHLVTDDLTAMVNATMARAQSIGMETVRINSRFVPAAQAPLLDALQAVLDDIEGSSLTAWDIASGGRNAENCQGAARSEFSQGVEGAEKELRRIQEEVAAAQAEDAEGRRGPRRSTIQTRIDEFKGLREKIEFYADLLSFKAGDMTTRLDAVRAGLGGLLGA